MTRIFKHVAVAEGAYGRASLFPIAVAAALFFYALLFPAGWFYFHPDTREIFDYTYTPSNAQSARELFKILAIREFGTGLFIGLYALWMAPIIWFASAAIQRMVSACKEQPVRRLHSCRADAKNRLVCLELFLSNIHLFILFLTGIPDQNKPQEITTLEHVAIRLREFIIIRRVGSVTAA
jgi:hypothetical protein